MLNKRERAKLRSVALTYIQSQGAHAVTIESFMRIFDAWVKYGKKWKENINENTVADELFDDFLTNKVEEV